MLFPSPTPLRTPGTPFYNLLTLAPVLGREAVKLLKRRMKRGRAKGASVPRADVASRLPDAVAALRVGSDDDEETVEEDRRRLGAKEKSNAEPLFFAGLQVDVTDYPDLSATALQLNSECAATQRRGAPLCGVWERRPDSHTRCV